MSSSRSASFAGSSLRLALLSSTMIAVALPFAAQAQSASPGGERPAQAQAGQIQFNVPPQELDSALTRVADQGGIRIFFTSAELSGLRTGGVSGAMTVEQALSQVLTGTGFGWRYREARTVVIEKLPAAQGAIQLGPVRVEGQSGRAANGYNIGAVASPATTESTHSYAARAVTIGKDEQPLKDVPQSVSVLTRQSMDDQNISTIAQALTTVPGITISKSPGTGYFIFSRGFTIDTMQFDGATVFRNGYSAGSYMAESMAFYDRMEVLRGAAGLIQGPNAPGGAVNLVRKRGQDQLTVGATATAGSWNHYAGQIDVGGPVADNGRLRIRAIADYDRSDSFVNMVWSKTRSLYFAADYDIDPDTVIGLGISNRDMRGRPFERGLPRYADGGDIGLPRSTFAGAEWNKTSSDRTMFYGDIEHRFSSQWSVKVSAVHFQEDSGATYQFLLGPVARTGARTETYSDFATDFHLKGDSLDAHVNGVFEALGVEHDVTIGADYMTHRTDDTIARQFRAESADVFNLNNDRTARSLESLIATQYSQRSWYDVEQHGLYGAWRLKPIQPLTFIAGARVTWYENSYRAKSGTQANYGAIGETKIEAQGKFVPYAGAIYALNSSWNVYASYAKIFEPQSVRDAAGNVLKPVEGVNYEAGVKGEVMDGRANLSLALFRYDHRNRAVYDFAGGYACNGWYCSQATGKVRSKGVEIEASGELAPGLQVSAGYTYNTTKFLEDPTYQGQRFSTYTPKHLLRLWANYTLPGRLDPISVGAGVNAQTGTLASDRSFDLPGFAIWNARLGYRLNDKISLAANLNNIFDKTYYIPSYSSTNGNNFYGDPRNFAVTLRAAF